ncbi:MAG: SAM-dependent methyltransferase, partial [Sphingobacteriia bacterium]|nr:SAM-dependent methyltransferase [Candidatus Fonsibacter lacus]
MSQDTILLSEQPISNRYIPRDAAIRPPIYHLGIKIDYELNLIRLDPHIPCEELRPRVPWINAFEPEKHLDKMVSEILNLPGISKDSVFGAYSFKDDSTLQRINNLGYLNSWRIDPKIDLGVSKKNAGIETFQAHLDNTSLFNLKKRHYAPDVFIARHVIEHSFDIMNFVNFVRK